MKGQKIELPPLPEPHTIQRVWEGYPYHAILKDTKFYTEQQVREAQQAAIEADRKRRGEPSSLAEVWRINADEAEAYGQSDRADTLRECAAAVERLAAPQPAEPRLDAPAQVGHTRFGHGVPWSTVIGAAQRYHAIENTPTKEQERMKKAAERLKAIQPAEPSKQSEVREYLQQTLRTAADEACRLIANSDTPTKFEGIFGHRAEQLDYASAAKVCRSVGANSFAECFERAAQHKAAKCDGDHGGLSCANPEHWNDSSD